MARLPVPEPMPPMEPMQLIPHDDEAAQIASWQRLYDAALGKVPKEESACEVQTSGAAPLEDGDM